MASGNYCRRLAGTAANDNSAGTTAWSNPDNAKELYNTVTSITLAAGVESQYLKLTNWKNDSGPDPIPATATIKGVAVWVRISQPTSDSHNNVSICELKLVKGGVIGGTSRHDSRAIAKTDLWTSAWMDYGDRSGTYFLPLDLWGNTLSAADIRASDFGVALRAKNNDGSANATLNIDGIIMVVYWEDTASVIIRTNASSSSLMAPCLIACDAIQSPVGDRDPQKCEFRWFVEGPVGWSPTVVTPVPGLSIENQVRYEATSKVGLYASWLATVPGTYTIRCRMYGDGDPITIVAEDTVIFTVVADTRTAAYIDPVGGNNSNGGTSFVDGYQTLAGAASGRASGGTVSNTKFIYKQGTALNHNNVTVTQNFNNCWITTESGTPVEMTATGTGGGLYFNNNITDLVIDRIQTIGDYTDGDNQKSFSFGGVVRNLAIDLTDGGMRSPAFGIELGAAGDNSDQRWIYIKGYKDGTNDAVATYGVYSNASAMVEIVGYDMDTQASRENNGHFRTGAPNTQDQIITTWRGIAWFLRWCHWDVTGANLGGGRLPVSYSGGQECRTTGSAIGWAEDPMVIGQRWESCYFDSSNAVSAGHGVKGPHVIMASCMFRDTGVAYSGGYADYQVHLLNCNLVATSPGAFEGIIRQYKLSAAMSERFPRSLFLENCIVYYDTAPGAFPAYWYCDRTDLYNLSDQNYGHFKNVVFPIDYHASDHFDFFDGSVNRGILFSGSTPQWTDYTAFVINNVEQRITTSDIISANDWEPDSSLTVARTAGTQIDGVYRDITGTLRTNWSIPGIRSGQAITYHQEASDASPAAPSNLTATFAMLGGNAITSSQDSNENHYLHLKYVTGNSISSQVCSIGGIPVCCFDLGDGTYALGVYEIASGLTDNGETAVLIGNRLAVTSYTDDRRVIETVEQSGGDAFSSSSTVWRGARLGINADGSILVQAVVATENDIEEVVSASIGGIPMRVVRVGGYLYLSVHTASTV